MFALGSAFIVWYKVYYIIATSAMPWVHVWWSQHILHKYKVHFNCMNFPTLSWPWVTIKQLGLPLQKNILLQSGQRQRSGWGEYACNFLLWIQKMVLLINVEPFNQINKQQKKKENPFVCNNLSTSCRPRSETPINIQRKQFSVNIHEEGMRNRESQKLWQIRECWLRERAEPHIRKHQPWVNTTIMLTLWKSN